MQKLEGPYKNIKKKDIWHTTSFRWESNNYEPGRDWVISVTWFCFSLCNRDKSHLTDHSKFYLMRTLFFFNITTNSPSLKMQSYTRYSSIVVRNWEKNHSSSARRFTTSFYSNNRKNSTCHNLKWINWVYLEQMLKSGEDEINWTRKKTVMSLSNDTEHMLSFHWI